MWGLQVKLMIFLLCAAQGGCKRNSYEQIYKKVLEILKNQQADGPTQIMKGIRTLEQQAYALHADLDKVSDRVVELNTPCTINQSKVEGWSENHTRKPLNFDKLHEIKQNHGHIVSDILAKLHLMNRDLDDWLYPDRKPLRFTTAVRRKRHIQESSPELEDFYEHIARALEGIQENQSRKLTAIAERLVQLNTCFKRVYDLASYNTIHDVYADISKLVIQDKQLTTKIEHLPHIKAEFYEALIADINEQIDKIYGSITSYSGCVEAIELNKHSGVYPIRSLRRNGSSFDVYCQKVPKGQGLPWTIIMRRQANSSDFVDFKQNWKSYRDGFGNLDGDHWLGLQHIFEITNFVRQELLVLTANEKDARVNSQFYDFRIADESKNFTIVSLGENEGFNDMGDCLNTPFNTYDRGDSDYVKNAGGAGFWGPCYYNINRQAKREGKLAIDILLSDLPVNYVQLAVRPYED